MRFAQAHKTSSYATITVAMLALVTGDGIAPPIAVLAVAGLIGSWWWEEPRVRVERWVWLFTAGAGLAFAWGMFNAITGGDYLGEGAGFVALLTVARAYTRHAAKDWLQLYLLSLLMLIAGSVLSGDLIYGVCFLVFVVSSTWTLILFHLRREMEENFLLKHADPRASERVEVRRILESHRIVDRRFFIGTGAISLAVFAVATLMFLTIPRVGMGFFFRSRSGLHMVGFSDGVKLGGHGRLKSDDTIVMRVQSSDPRLHGRGALYVYWRGVAFDHYVGGEWTRSLRAPMTLTQVERPSAMRERRKLLELGPSGEEMSARRHRATRQEVWLSSLGSDVLFAASKPLAFELDVVPNARPSTARNDEVRAHHEVPIHYTAWSEIAVPEAVDPGSLRAAVGELPTGFEVYLQVPSEITARTLELAAEITRGATTNYDKAVRLRDWLIANRTYTTELRDPRGQEPIDFFLFERQAGHCEYFASAFAIMARSVGVPTRSVNGFLGGEWNEYDGYIAVRAGDAHSWAEVWFPGYGWLTFDATPPGEVDRLGRGGDGWTERLGRWLDTLGFQWNKWVIDYDLYQQLSLFRSVGDALSGGSRQVSSAGTSLKRWFVGHWRELAAGAAVVALVGALWRRRRARAATGEERRDRRERSEIAALYERAAARFARHGHRREPAVTPRELARELAARGVAQSGAFTELTELYYAAAWGGAATAEMLDRARQLADVIASTPKPGVPR